MAVCELPMPLRQTVFNPDIPPLSLTCKVGVRMSASEREMVFRDEIVSLLETVIPLSADTVTASRESFMCPGPMAGHSAAGPFSSRPADKSNDVNIN